jgi:hypothetical protein
LGGGIHVQYHSPQQIERSGLAIMALVSASGENQPASNPA